MKASFDNVFDKARLVNDLKESLFEVYRNPDWKDDVHDSYISYLNKLEDFSNYLKDISLGLKNVQETLSQIPEAEKINNGLRKIEIELEAI